MYLAYRAGRGLGEGRLAALVPALQLLSQKIRSESEDIATALAIRDRFRASLADIEATASAVALQVGAGRQSSETLSELHAALQGLAAALTFPLPEAEIVPLSRPVARRARLRAGRLDSSARDLLSSIGKVLVGGVAAATLYYASPAAAGCVVSAPNATCTGNVSAGQLYIYPSIDTVTVDSLTSNIVGGVGVNGVVLVAGANNGSGGAPFTSGDPGDNGHSVILSASDATHHITTTNAIGLFVGSAAGNGGNGGGAGVGGDGGDGGHGGDAGSATANVDIDINTHGDNAHGVVALSVGGTGGNGGDFDVGVGAAGDGGQGGAGGAVTVNLGAYHIITNGKNADGIFASSLGGGGGDAGACNVAFCGASGGGDSAIGGAVTVTTAAGSLIETFGGFSKGIKASSIGGYAGNGGSSYVAANFASNGGSAGDGGKVVVTNGGTILTHKGTNDAIFAQSIGGGGGDGGDSGASITALGGNGSQGGNGGEVDVTNASTGKIETFGTYARGIFAQSIGGSGGAGGTASSLISVGGNGSGTSDGGLVHVENQGVIITNAAYSQDIFAQSIGGGGGDGGSAGGLAAVGGTAGGGGKGGTVEIINSGTATTSAKESFAILGMSIGGGGGDGGGTGGLVAVGGTGGDGGDGGDVTITSGGIVHTAGYHSKAIMAQSVGGGGGEGGDATSAGAFVNVSVGGTGGHGGDGKSVTVTTDSTSDILTEGARSEGIQAQSVGGGGGEGGYGAGASAGAFGSISIGVGGTGGDGGKGGNVQVTSAGTIVTEGVNSRGIFAQSVGGGGGDGGFAVAAAFAGGPAAGAGAISVGGSGGSGQDAGTVNVDNTATIDTTGDRSSGLYAQSVGGGGGSGGWSGAIAGAGGPVAGAITVSVGGAGSGGGDGSTVDVDNGGDIHTRGVDAFGLLAQSVGGGGGNGGFSVAASGAGGATAGGVAVTIGGGGALGGNGSTVGVTTSGTIVTEGDRSDGVIAQSVGGGGGNGGFSGGIGVGAGGAGGGGVISVGGSAGAGGGGGVVTLDSLSDVLTKGVDADGIIAQSVGGGGGLGGFSVGAAVGAGTLGVGATVNVGGGGGAGGSASTVTLTSSGDIVTEGDRSIGVLSQSVGGGGGDGGFTGSIGVGAGTTGVGIAIGVGGFGGVGGGGAKATLVSSGDVQTSGVDAMGLFAQSVGGGGGNGGFSAAVGVGAGANAGAGSLTMGGFGGAAGSGADVILTSTGQVTTFGDRSTAIQAQSVGGGGGHGGIAASFTGAFSSTTPVSIGLSMGGFGGAAGNAGTVTLTSTGGASTTGDDAHGVFAQSVGGGGGDGGFTASGALSAGGSNSIGLKASVGGFGGAAGDGGDVTVTAGGLTHTTGDGSNGILAQSIGGGGGNGGWAGNLTGSLSSTKSFAISATLGGRGGAAGSAGDVLVTSNGQVLTEGSQSHGVFAQSVGGGGGIGGFAVSANVGATKATNIGVSIGGFGGASGAAGIVTVNANGAIETKGDGSIGIFAQSVGGGGGAGGAGGALAFSSSDSINLTTSMGGFGANGSVGNTVNVTNSGTILTLGELSQGILAQSVGGGGGHGGMAGIDENGWKDYLAGGSASVSFGQRSQNISVSLGGFGGIGQDGGVVTVINSGAIETDGPGSNVIDAESVGGGGGDGGVATAASGAFGTGKNGTYSIAMGGSGGVAGDGGLVDVHNSGSLLATNAGSMGIFAQSVGGGGGAGGDARGFSLSFSTAKKNKGAVSVNVSLGGKGGAAGDGGEVRVGNTGQIVTDGPISYGVFAQSVGGGGGDGGGVSTQGDEIPSILELVSKGDAKGGQIAIGGSAGAAGDGGAVTVTNGGLIWTKGFFSHGVFAQSVGGGGGNGGDGLAGEVSIGGQGGAAGDGGTVQVINSKFIETDGQMAKGIYAQSIGGGGGTGGATDYTGDTHFQYLKGLADTMNVVDNLIPTIEAALSFKEPEFGIGIGGFGGAAGDGGTVTVSNTGGILTKGDFSTGIFAQSVGGGGGAGGEGILTKAGQVVFSGLGGSSGDGGTVKVVNAGTIQTNGFGAYGILAQSVGGGGGMAGDYALGIASWGNVSQFGGEDYSKLLNLQLNPFHANGGDGGDVTVINTGDIIINGVGAVGIFAQSVGGGGGLLGGKLGLAFAGSMDGVGHAGKVTITQNGNVFVSGKNAIGAYFQSASKDGNDDIIAVLNGAVTGGSVYGKALLVDGGKNNNITLNGLVQADSHIAVASTIGNDVINANAGVIGNVDLGIGTNAFNNNHTSTFQTLDYVLLNGGALTNAGVVSPGGPNAVQTTQVGGDFVQTTNGVLDTNLDMLRVGKSGEVDQLDMSGSINAQGDLVLKVLNPGYALPGDHTVTVLDANGAVNTTGLTLDRPVSAVASFQLQTTAHQVNLHYGIDFSPAGLNANQTAVGDGINNVLLNGGSPDFAAAAAQLFYVPSLSELAAIYDSVTPETYADQAAALTFASQQFADSMMSCPTSSAAVSFPEHGCLWAKPDARWLTLSGTGSNLSFRENTLGVAAGWEAAVKDSSWRLGGAMSAEHADSALVGHTSSKGWRYQGGVDVKKSVDNFTLAVALHGGMSTMDTRRTVLLPAGPVAAEGSQKLSYLAATARASYRMGSDQGYLKPMLEVSQLEVDTKGFTETGAGGLGLTIPKQNQQYTRVSAKLEAGSEFESHGAAIRPFARAGVSHLAGGDADLYAAAFAAAPAGTQGFSVSPGLDRTTFDAEAGVAIVGKIGSARLSWAGQYGDRTHNQMIALKFTKSF